LDRKGEERIAGRTEAKEKKKGKEKKRKRREIIEWSKGDLNFIRMRERWL